LNDRNNISIPIPPISNKQKKKEKVAALVERLVPNKQVTFNSESTMQAIAKYGRNTDYPQKL
jgi:hypothetical protein